MTAASRPNAAARAPRRPGHPIDLSVLTLGLSLFLPAGAAGAAESVPLFDGKTLEGWVQRGGKAKYTVEDGAIVGRTIPRTPNSFLCTEKDYADFVLEYEFKVDEAMNSGVQIRSNSLPDYKNGRVHGYQVEIDPDTKRGRLWTGGIYDEGRRGWLNDLAGNDAARKAFKPEDWNHIKVEAIGPAIKTWVNGVPAADLVDPMTPSGFIGLQVHGIGNKPGGPFEVRWRNLRIVDLGEPKWEPLFDGKTLSGWKPLPGGKWEVADGAIVGTSPRSERRHGILLTDARFKNFDVRARFRVHAGDSGFYFRVDPVKGSVSVHGFQVEVDSSQETGGLYETGGRGWVVKPTDKEIPKKKYRPGEWTDLSVHAHGGRVVVHINGVNTAELRDDPGRREGNIGLQLHGGQEMHVEFKDLAVRRR